MLQEGGGCAPVDAEELGLASALKEQDAGGADDTQLVAQVQVVAAKPWLVRLCLPCEPKSARASYLVGFPVQVV